jgi:tRNA(Leu) C34 or U34 (ribose-2'-O)-methylase TrmL
MKENLPEFDLGDEINVKKDIDIFNEFNTPAIIMYNPKYPHNVGSAVRACSCFNSNLIIFTGNRVSLTPDEGKGGYRLPREERMKGYDNVQLVNDEYPFNRFSKDVTPVAVEVRHNAEILPNFIHPENPVYVFGPEDGSLPQVYLKHCQRFLYIPSPFCTNLAAAIYIVLYDRMAKLMRGEATVRPQEDKWIQERYLKMVL